MSLLETKVLQVENDQEAITNMSNVMGSFGWTVLSVQVTHSQNSKDLGDRVQTTTINYATMTLQRDKHMPNYAEIVRLEDEYYRLKGTYAQRENAYEKQIEKLVGSHMKNRFIGLIAAFYIWPVLLIAKVLSCITKGKVGQELLDKVLPGSSTNPSAEQLNTLRQEKEQFEQNYLSQMAEIRQQAESLLA